MSAGPPHGAGSAYDRVLNALTDAGRRVQARGEGQASAQCPAHDDRTPSLSVTRSEAGVLIHCNAGCDVEDVLAALGLRMPDLFDARREPRPGPTVTSMVTPRMIEYPYRDETGQVLYVKVRRHPKRFSQYRPLPGGGRLDRLGDVRRVLYRLPEVLAAVAAGRTVWLGEGEKDADSLTRAGVCATTWSDGAWPAGQKPRWRGEYTKALVGAHVVIVADDDPTGRHTGGWIAEAIRPVAASVRVVLPAVGKDATDHLTAGHGLDDFRPLDGADVPPADGPIDGAGDGPAGGPEDGRGGDEPDGGPSDPTGDPLADLTGEEARVAAVGAYLAGLEPLPRRQAVYALIGRLTGAPAAVVDAYRCLVCTEHRWMSLADWRDAAGSERQAARQAVREQAAAARQAQRITDREHPYLVRGGCLYRRTGDGDLLVARFTARVVADITRDDGTERTVLLRIECATPSGRTQSVDVTGEQVGNVRRWSMQALGSEAVMPPTPQGGEHVLTAAQLLGEDDGIVRVTEYVHTGWRTLDGVHRYLSAAGALGADGLDATVRVDLGSEVLNEYRLIDPAGVPRERVRAAVRTSLALIEVGSDKVTVPQLATAYRAVLPLPPDTSVFVEGRSGSLKSAYSAVVLNHFGAGFDGKRLPAEWKSSANALEGQAHQLAHVLFIVDEYAPQAVEDPRKLAAAADRVLRGVANASGRGRMRPDGTLRPVKPPRAQVLTTGEDAPPGQSLRARLTIIHVDPTSYDRTRLTTAQHAGADGTLVVAMSAYIAWLAARRDTEPDLPARLRARMTALRTDLQGEGGGGHLRTPEASASLLLGWEAFLAFAVDIGAITREQQTGLTARVRAALAEVAADQGAYIGAADPVGLYLAALRAALAAGSAHLADTRTGGVPARQPAACGWRTTITQGERYTESLSPGGPRIGWITPDGQIYLDPGAAYTTARTGADRAGTPLATTERTITRRLHEAGKLAATDGRNLAVKRPIPAVGRPRVLWLTPGVLLDPQDDADDERADEPPDDERSRQGRPPADGARSCSQE